MHKPITGRFTKPRSTAFHRQSESMHLRLPRVVRCTRKKMLVPKSSGVADRQDSEKGQLTINAYDEILMGANFIGIFKKIVICQWFNGKPPQ